MNLKSFFVAAASTVGILTLSSPASAVIYDWQFTNEDGNFGSATDVVAGFAEFNDADVASGSASAIDLQITSVTNLPNGSDPFFGDGGVELNQNLVPFTSSNNNFTFNAGEIVSSNLTLSVVDDTSTTEFFRIRDTQSLLQGSSATFFQDIGSSSLTFTQQASASVPFEFSPTLGLFLVGSIFAGRGYTKRRQARSIVETK